MTTSNLNPADFAQFVLFISKYNHDSADTIASIAREIEAPVEVLDVIMGLGEYEFGKAHAELAKRLYYDLDEATFAIDQARLAKLAIFVSDETRFHVANNSATSRETMDYLANDINDNVRRMVAKNSDNAETVELLSNDENEHVRKAAKNNRNC